MFLYNDWKVGGKKEKKNKEKKWRQKLKINGKKQQQQNDIVSGKLEISKKHNLPASEYWFS